MTIYLVQVFLILLMGAGFHPAKNEKNKKCFLFLTFIILTTVSGLRGYTVGADTSVYVRLFRNIEHVNIYNTRYEPGFITYLKLLHAISSSPTFFLFVSSAICVGSYCLLTNAFSKRPAMSMLLYITLGAYFAQMNTMRQSLALSFTGIAFMLVLQKSASTQRNRIRMIVSALLIVLSTLFHTIAIVAFIPWFLLVKQGETEEESKLSMQYAVLQTVVIAMLGFLGYSLIMRLTTMLFPIYAKYFRGTWSDANYFASLLKTLIYVVFLLTGSMFLNRKRLTYLQRFGAIMVGLSIVFSVLSMRMEIWGRVSGIFGIYTYLIWVPEFLSEIKLPSNKRVVEVFTFVFSLAYMIVVLVFRPEWTLVVPYRFV